LRRLEWTERASADLVKLLGYYANIDPDLAPAMRRRVVAAQRPLLDRPGIGSPTGRRGTRKWRVRGTPFLLFYRISSDGTLQVVNVRHAAQNWRAE